MRLWFSGPRLFGGFVRPGVSFDLRGRPFGAAAPRAVAGDFVYVIEGAHGHVKIGVSRDPFVRVASLQTGSPYALEVAWREFAGDNAYAIEAEAHAMLGRHRVAGEWFDVPREAAIGAVYGAAYRLGAPLGEVAAVAPPRRLSREASAYILVAGVALFLVPLLIANRGGDAGSWWAVACAVTLLGLFGVRRR